MLFRDSIRKAVGKAAQELIGDSNLPDFAIEVPEDANHGDYATNAALILGKHLKRNPFEVAGELSEELNDERWEASAAAPGFVNFKLTDSALKGEFAKILCDPDAWGSSNVGEGKTVIVEYFQLNIAKRPHIGHLRSAVIGDALKRILLNLGYNAVSDTHVGDWGTQFGILLLGYKEFQSVVGEKEIAEDPFALLEDIYAKENAKIESNPSRRDLAKEEFAKLERGDPENRKIWEWMVEVSMKKLEESAERLHLLPFDEHKGESSYEADMPPIVREALKKGVAVKKEDGAVIVDLAADKLDEAVLIKSDGASTYLLRDLAAIKYRKVRWNFWRNLYLVDVRQAHHFKQLFKVAELLNFDGVGESEHVDYGFWKLPEGAISTRKGTAIALEKLIDESEKRAREIIQEKNPDLANSQAIASIVGIGAIKYFDLAHHRKSDIVFDWGKALSFEGDTGPYLQYTRARFASILRKAGIPDVRLPESGQNSAIELERLERGLLVSILRFPEALEDVIVAWSPHVLASYLFGLAQAANEFYHASPVLQETDEAKRALRLALAAAFSITMGKGLNLLGIEAPEEM